ncbi:hypothetical protein VCHE45_0060 [Vibrio cholerae HE-45]|nr:hypothetical protein VCHE45_0060 [Vibrio cholerae HE-45]
MGMNSLAAYLQLQVVWGARAKTKPNSKELGLTFDYSKRHRFARRFA